MKDLSLPGKPHKVITRQTEGSFYSEICHMYCVKRIYLVAAIWDLGEIGHDHLTVGCASAEEMDEVAAGLRDLHFEVIHSPMVVIQDRTAKK